jgi:hypothetical protein
MPPAFHESHLHSPIQAIVTLTTAGPDSGGQVNIVVLSTTPPELSYYNCLRGNNDISACTFFLPPNYYTNDLDLQQQAAALFNASFIDLTPWFCVEVTCPPIVDGVPIMATDGRHLNYEIAPSPTHAGRTTPRGRSLIGSSVSVRGRPKYTHILSRAAQSGRGRR